MSKKRKVVKRHREYFRSSSKILGRGRGMSPRSLELIEAMRDVAEAVQPITCRGVCYKLFVAKLIRSMAPKDIAPIYRLLKIARERYLIDWDWIVDETRNLDRVAT